MEGRIRACGPSADLTAWHAEVGQFLRHWGTAIAGLPVQQQIALANLMDSARASLLGLLEATSRAASAQSATAQAEGWRQAEMRQRQAMEQAEHRRRMEAGQAEVRRLQDETARIQAETYRSGQLSQERNFQLSRAALFPENHCPYCSRSYTDLSSGCWHCHAWPSGR